jgi:hypothetical protein
MECLECPSSSRGIEVKFFFTWHLYGIVPYDVYVFKRSVSPRILLRLWPKLTIEIPGFGIAGPCSGHRASCTGETCRPHDSKQRNTEFCINLMASPFRKSLVRRLYSFVLIMAIDAKTHQASSWSSYSFSFDHASTPCRKV